MFYFGLDIKNISLKTPTTKNCVQKYTFNLQEMYAVHNLEDCIGKEELYLRKTTIFDVWDYYSSNYEFMFIQLYWIIKTNSM